MSNKYVEADPWFKVEIVNALNKNIALRRAIEDYYSLTNPFTYYHWVARKSRKLTIPGIQDIIRSHTGIQDLFEEQVAKTA